LQQVTALDFANNQTRYLDKIITLRPGVSGELTSHAYTGVGQERPLENGKTYFWRVTATAPSMIGRGMSFPSRPFTFQYGHDIPEEIALIAPSDGSHLEVDPPVFRWRYSGNERPSHFEIEVKNSQDQTYALIEERFINIPETEEKSYTYGRYPDQKELQDGKYLWKITTIIPSNGRERRLESEEWGFSYITTYDQNLESALLRTVSPMDGEAIPTNIYPLFKWFFDDSASVTSFRINFYRRENEQALTQIDPDGNHIATGDLFRSDTRPGPFSSCPVGQLPTNELLAWQVIAFMQSGETIESNVSTFSIGEVSHEVIYNSNLLMTTFPRDGGDVSPDILPVFGWFCSESVFATNFDIEFYRVNQPGLGEGIYTITGTYTLSDGGTAGNGDSLPPGLNAGDDPISDSEDDLDDESSGSTFPDDDGTNLGRPFMIITLDGGHHRMTAVEQGLPENELLLWRVIAYSENGDIVISNTSTFSDGEQNYGGYQGTIPEMETD